MKKFLLSLFAVVGLSGIASADSGIFHVGYATQAVTGVTCSTGTVFQLNLTRPTGFKGKVVGYRIQNQDSGDAVWIGGVTVSTSAESARGEMLGPGSPGDSGVWMVGYDYIRATPIDVPLYCRAADAAGAAGVMVSVSWFGN